MYLNPCNMDFFYTDTLTRKSSILQCFGSLYTFVNRSTLDGET